LPIHGNLKDRQKPAAGRLQRKKSQAGNFLLVNLLFSGYSIFQLLGASTIIIKPMGAPLFCYHGGTLVLRNAVLMQNVGLLYALNNKDEPGQLVRRIIVRRKKIFPIPFLAISLLLVLTLSGCGPEPAPTGGTGGKVTLAWEAPTTNADGSTPLNDLAGYKIFYRNPGQTFDFTRPVATIEDSVTPKTVTYTFNLPAGEYYFVVKAYDLSGNESDPSNSAPLETEPPHRISP